jgi:hypothetical protein
MVSILRPKVVYGERLESGVKIEANRPLMDDLDKEQYVWVRPGKTYQFNTETEEILERS